MFTGLVEEIGKIKSITPLGGGYKIAISCSKILNEIKIGDSININGACQTVEKFDKDSFEVTAVEETISKTTLGKLKRGDRVNLESSLTLNKKLGGHFVLGHVDTTGKIISIIKKNTSYLVEIFHPQEYSKYIIHVGAVAIDGISLTIADFKDQSFVVSVIPHTWHETILQERKPGDLVNIEFDVLGKYVSKIIDRGNKGGITADWLKEMGF